MRSFLESISRGKSKTIKSPTILPLEDNTYDAVVIHVGINDLLSNVKSTNGIGKEIIGIGLRCRNNNIG